VLGKRPLCGTGRTTVACQMDRVSSRQHPSYTSILNTILQSNWMQMQYPPTNSQNSHHQDQFRQGGKCPSSSLNTATNKREDSSRWLVTSGPEFLQAFCQLCAHSPLPRVFSITRDTIFHERSSELDNSDAPLLHMRRSMGCLSSMPNTLSLRSK
jgi:hypothetical protein